VHCQIGNDMLSGVWMVFHDASGTAWVIAAKDAGQSVGPRGARVAARPEEGCR